MKEMLMWLSDITIVLPDGVIERGALRIEDETIAEIVEGPVPAGATGVLSAPEMTVVPGIIDLHGDMLERDIEPRPSARFPTHLGLYELDKRLAAAGITTAYAAVSFSWTKEDLRSQEEAQEIIAVINDQRDHLMVDMRVHARIEVTNPLSGPILAPLVEQGLVHLVSVMDHTPGQGQYKNVDRYVNFMSRWMGFNPDEIGDDILDRIKSAIIMKSAAPADWSIAGDIAALAKKHNIPMASHDDDTIEKVTMMAEYGVTISEFPVTLEGAQEAKRRGMHVVMGAPNAYRGQSTSEGNLSALDAIKAGVVDILATDYFPAAPFQAAYKMAEQGDMPLYESIKLVSQTPAEAMGLSDRGRIATGLSADLVLFETGKHHPRIRATFRQGVPIFWDSTMARLAQQQDFRFTNVKMESA
jgi:alpha-D-ribose 1-methylphosphonate 5-triphosphate diphosphatase